jgi:hypothetical protein
LAESAPETVMADPAAADAAELDAEPADSEPDEEPDEEPEDEPEEEEEEAPPRTTFADLGLSAPILRAVSEAGYLHPPPIQEQAIPVVLMGRDVLFKRITSGTDMLTLVTHLEQIQAKEGPDGLPGQTLVLDSLSHYADLVIEEIAAGRKNGMDQQGWGALATHFRLLQQRLRNLDLHVIYTSLAETLTNDTGAAIGGRPRLTGAARDMLPSACDLILYLDVRDSVGQAAPIHRAYSRPKAGYIARSRFPTLPGEMTLGTTPGATLWDQLRPHVGG